MLVKFEYISETGKKVIHYKECKEVFIYDDAIIADEINGELEAYESVSINNNVVYIKNKED